MSFERTDRTRRDRPLGLQVAARLEGRAGAAPYWISDHSSDAQSRGSGGVNAPLCKNVGCTGASRDLRNCTGPIRRRAGSIDAGDPSGDADGQALSRFEGFGGPEAARRAAQHGARQRVLPALRVNSPNPKRRLERIWRQSESTTELVRAHGREDNAPLANVLYADVRHELAARPNTLSCRAP